MLSSISGATEKTQAWMMRPPPGLQRVRFEDTEEEHAEWKRARKEERHALGKFLEEYEKWEAEQDAEWIARWDREAEDRKEEEKRMKLAEDVKLLRWKALVLHMLWAH